MGASERASVQVNEMRESGSQGRMCGRARVRVLAAFLEGRVRTQQTQEVSCVHRACVRLPMRIRGGRLVGMYIVMRRQRRRRVSYSNILMRTRALKLPTLAMEARRDNKAR